MGHTGVCSKAPNDSPQETLTLVDEVSQFLHNPGRFLLEDTNHLILLHYMHIIASLSR